MVVYAFSTLTREADVSRSPEFEASLVHKASSTTAKAIQRNPASKTKARVEGWGESQAVAQS